MKNKMLSSVFAVLISQTICCISLYASPYSGGEGSSDSPYRIGTEADMMVLATNTADYGKCFVMESDIDFSGEIFTNALIAPDLSNSGYSFNGTKFTGVFDGDGHKISNFSIITGTNGCDHLGVFGYVSGQAAVIKDLVVENVSITADEDSLYVGGLVGNLYYGTLLRCSISGCVKGQDSYIGGLVGYHNSGTLSDCSSSCSVNGGDEAQDVGGLVGYSAHVTVSGCIASGAVNGNEYVGGLVGYCQYGTLSESCATSSVVGGDSVGGLCGYCYIGDIIESYATGSVSGNDSVGGLCGYNYTSELREVYATGNVSGNDYIGGLCGRNAGGSIDSSYASGYVDGRLFVGGLCGSGNSGISDSYFYFWGGPANGAGSALSLQEMQVSSSYEGFDFDGVFDDGDSGIWSITNGYLPKLSWQGDDGSLLPVYGVPETTLTGAGIRSSPLEINSYADFLEFCDNDKLDRGFYILNTDLDLSITNFTASPINRQFGGSFNGGEHAIRNMIVDTQGVSSDYLGLFSLVSGSVTDLSVVISEIIAGSSSEYVGGLCGYSYYGSFKNVTYIGSVTGYDYIGGLCGYNLGGSIRSSSAAGTISGNDFVAALCGDCQYGVISNCYMGGSVCGYDDLGGVCGRAGYSGIYDCYSTASVSGNAYSHGGLCGYVSSSTIRDSHATGDVSGSYSQGGLCGSCANSTVSRSYATGSVSGSNDYCGGLCGQCSGCEITECYANGSVNGDNYVGGLCGRITSSSTINKCYATGNAAARDYVGGLCGYVQQSVVSECYSIGLTESSVKIHNSPGGLCGFNSQGTVSDCCFYQWGGLLNGYGVPLSAEEMQDTSNYQGFDFEDISADGTNETWRISSGSLPCLNWQHQAAPLPPTNGLPSTILSGEGTYVSPFEINSFADFQEFCGNAELDRGFYALNANLNMILTNFTAAAVDRAFGGVFYGNGHVIRNVAIDTLGESTGYLGLFSVLNGNVSDLGVVNISVNSGTKSQYAGGICGLCYGVITNCCASGSVTNGSDYTGGICGRNDGGIYTSFSTVNVTGGGTYVGGISGYNTYGNISCCYSRGSVDGNQYVGGLCGYNYRGYIDDCYAAGTLSAGSFYGGLCAYNNGSVTDSFWDSQLSGITSGSYGTGKTTAVMQAESTYTDAGWDFVGESENGNQDIWIMDDYPVLAGLSFSLESSSGFGDWLSDEGVSASDGGAWGNPAGDGIPNLLKYACGLSADTSCSSSDLFALNVDASGFSIIYHKSKVATDVSLEAVWSSELGGSWLSSGVTCEKISENAESEEWKATIPLEENGFMRLRASLIDD